MSRSLPDVQKSVTAATIAGTPATFVNLGTPTTKQYTKFWLLNLTDKLLEFSWDGADNVNLSLPPNSGYVSDEATNAPNNTSKPCLLGSGTQFRVRSVAAEIGNATTGVPTIGTAKANGEYIA